MTQTFAKRYPDGTELTAYERTYGTHRETTGRDVVLLLRDENDRILWSEIVKLPDQETQKTGTCPSCDQQRPAYKGHGIFQTGSVCPKCGHVEPPTDRG